MNWIRTAEKLPQVDPGGESDYVLAYHGYHAIPLIVKYSDGSYSKRGWWTQDFKHIPFYSRRNGAPTFSHWCEMELPKDEEL